MESCRFVTSGIRAEDPSSAGAFFSINYQPGYRNSPELRPLPPPKMQSASFFPVINYQSGYRNLPEPRPLPPPKMQSAFIPVATYQPRHPSLSSYGDYLAAEETPATRPLPAPTTEEECHCLVEKIVQKFDEILETMRSMTTEREVRTQSEAVKMPPLVPQYRSPPQPRDVIQPSIINQSPCAATSQAAVVLDLSYLVGKSQPCAAVVTPAPYLDGQSQTPCVVAPPLLTDQRPPSTFSQPYPRRSMKIKSPAPPSLPDLPQQASDLALRRHNPAITGRSTSTTPPPLLNRSAAVTKSDQFELELVNPTPILSDFSALSKKFGIPKDNNSPDHRLLRGSEMKCAIYVEISAGSGKADDDEVDDECNFVKLNINGYGSKALQAKCSMIGWGDEFQVTAPTCSMKCLTKIQVIGVSCSMKCPIEFQMIGARFSMKWLDYDKRVSKI